MQSMSSARRNKLQLIREREAMKARLGRLQTMLLQKLTYKYGSKRNPSSRLNREIEDEIKAFTARSSGQPTDQDFLELENNVRELRTKYCKSGSVTSRQGGDRSIASSGGQREVTPGSSGKGKPSGVDGSEDGKSSVGDTLPLSIARAWRTFDVAKQIEYETKEQEKAEKSRQQKVIFREELEVHRTQQAQKKIEEEEERRGQMQEQERKLAEFRAEQEAVKKRAADRHAEEKGLREQQVKRLQAEKEVERQARLEREMQDIELCKAQLQSEVNDMERGRKAEKDRLASIQAENYKQKEVRAQKQRESDDADAKLLKEHRQRVDEEERKRATKLKDRMKRYEEIGNFWSERGAGRVQADANKREELLTLKEARRKEDAHIERERKESEKKRMATLAMATENRKVIEQKNALNQKKRKEDLEFAQRFISDSETFRQEEKDKKTHKKEAMARYRKELERQVEETKARRKHEDMNDTEFKLNSDLVKRLEADKRMVAQVRQRMESAT